MGAPTLTSTAPSKRHRTSIFAPLVHEIGHGAGCAELPIKQPRLDSPFHHEHRAQGVFLCGLRHLTHLDVEGVILKHRLGSEGRVNGFARSTSVPLGRICFRNDSMVPSERIS